MVDIDMKQIRECSVRVAEEYGCPTNPHLPLLDHPEMRSIDEVFDRLLCMQIAAALACIRDPDRFREESIMWLKHEGAFESLVDEERQFVLDGIGDPQIYIGRIEGEWALAWVLNIVGVLDFGERCHPDFISLLPSRELGSSRPIRMKAKLRPVETVLQKLDTAYCLHWGIVHCQTTGEEEPLLFPEVVVERRRALEWCLYPEPWDEVNMDT